MTLLFCLEVCWEGEFVKLVKIVVVGVLLTLRFGLLKFEFAKGGRGSFMFLFRIPLMGLLW